MAYRARLIPQFHWSSLQAIEKYLKAILLYNRIKARDINHDLSKALGHIKELPFKLKLSNSSLELIRHLDKFGRFRYLESSFYVFGPKLIELDKTIWEIRRYCKHMNYQYSFDDGHTINGLDLELAKIEQSDQQIPQKLRIMGGVLEKIIENKRHEAREPLLWRNAFFGTKARNTLKIPIYMDGTNAPLSLHPEILEEVNKYVYLPKEVIQAYRKHKPRISARGT